MAQTSEVNREQNQESLQFLPGADKIDIRKKLQVDVGFKVIMNEITARLKSINMLDRFRNSCFGHFLEFDGNFKLRGQLILLLKKCQLDVPNSVDLLFRIRGTELRFGREHFCMYTGLKFGGSTLKPADNQAPPAGGIYQTYFAGRTVLFDELREMFNNATATATSEHLLSAAFIFFIMHLFGCHGKVPHWLWSIVEDPKFEDFPWGLYIYGMTVFHFNYDFVGPPPAKYRLKGYPMALQLWIVDCIPALGKELKKYRTATDPLSSGFPTFLRWEATKRNLSLRNEVDDNFVECKSINQVGPTTLDREQVYMTSIDSPPHLDIVKYVNSEVARVGRRIGEDRIAKRPRKGNTITIPATLTEFVASIKKDMVEKFGALVQECAESAFQKMLVVEEDVPMKKAAIRQALKSVQYTSCVDRLVTDLQPRYRTTLRRRPAPTHSPSAAVAAPDRRRRCRSKPGTPPPTKLQDRF